MPNSNTMEKKLTIALTGNPNAGKTSIFNALTGARQHVANYPGVTVETVHGLCRFEGRKIQVVDLPGIYSLSAFSAEELVTRKFIFEQKPDVIVDIVDSSNPERNLYLAVQLMEMGLPLVLAFNMSDMAAAQGLRFDLPTLSLLLDVPIVQTVGRQGKGTDDLLRAAIQVSENFTPRRVQVRYNPHIESAIEKIAAHLTPDEHCRRFGKRWIATKLLEQDQEITDLQSSQAVAAAVAEVQAELQKHFTEKPDIIIAENRYGFISGACQETIRTTVESRHNWSDQVDTVLLHSVWGLPIFALLMYLVFYLTFTLGAVPMDWLESLFGWLSSWLAEGWPAGLSADFRSLVIDGIIGGVGSVIVFLPNILLLFLGIAILEDTGYMARAAFLMDRIMHRIGLHGKSFIPMLIGFGCSVPAIMATRILENRRDRLTTMMIIPLMSCGARITIYSLIIPAFFAPIWRGPMMWLIYMIGIVIAVVAARLLRKTLFRGQTMPFVMELPPYRMPSAKSLALHTWDRGKMYLQKAGTVILGLSIVLWAAATYPKPSEQAIAGLSEPQLRQVSLEQSLVGRAGRWIEPAIRPLGFDWRIGTSMVGAAVAKEVFVTQLGIVFSLGDSQDTGSLEARLQKEYSPLTGFCIMLFCLIGMPCVATVAITAKESGAWKWAVLQYTMLTVLAYTLTLMVYQTGRLLGG